MLVVDFDVDVDVVLDADTAIIEHEG